MRRPLLLAALVFVAAEVFGCGSTFSGEPDGKDVRSRVWAHADSRVGSMLEHSLFREHDGSFTSPDRARIRARLPKTLSEPFHLFPTGRRDENFAITPALATPAEGHEANGIVTYENAYVGTDLVFATNEKRVEQFYVLRGPEAPRAFRSNVALPPGFHGEVRANAWWVTGAEGAFALHASAPFALDARGVRIPARLGWSESEHELTIELSEASTYEYPLLLDPSFEVEAWEEVPRPAGGLANAFSFDQDRGEALLFVGSSNVGVKSETWTWNGSWTRRTSKNLPPSRTQASIAYDAARKRTVLFGGATSAGANLSDTWLWDGVEWTLQSPAHRPEPLTSARLAFDAARGNVVLFGGYTNGVYSTATWTWDGTDWTLLPAVGPTMQAIYGAYDISRGYVVAFGVTPSYARETWLWNGATWSKAAPSNQPFLRAELSLVYDGNHPGVFAMGTDVSYTQMEILAFNGTNWVPVPTASVPVASMDFAFDTKRSQLLGVGGYFRMVGGLSTDLWMRSAAGSWSRDPESQSPSGRNLSGMVSAPGGTALVVGGDSGSALSDNWVLSGNRWEEKTPASKPGPRKTSAMAFDTKRQLVVLFGGTDDSLVPKNDTWLWDGSVWSLAVPATKPPATETPQMTYDALRDRTLLLVNGPAAIDLWQWDGTTWSSTSPATKPPPRTNAAFAFDRTRGSAMLFGGLGNNGPFADTWLWNGTDWTDATKGTRPSPRYGTAATWDAKRGRIVLFGGVTSAYKHLNDIWSWDGSAWSSLVDEDLTVFPEGRANMGLTTFESSGRIVVQGGRSAVGFLTDQWIFHTRGGTCTSGAECGSGHCVDGVCCEVASCGTCETCAGIDAGKCSKVVNAEDADSCSAKSGRSCDASGVCQNGLGATCNVDSDCAGKHCVSGFCCNAACNLPCEACAAADKLTQNDNGRCGPAKVGTNPGGRCGETATCNLQGTCETRTLARCEGASELDVGGGVLQNCAPYRCRESKSGEAASCLRTCKTVADCAFPATCNQDGRCEERSLNVDDSGCSMRAPSAGPGGRERGMPELVVGGLVAMLLGARRRRNRAGRSAPYARNS